MRYDTSPVIKNTILTLKVFVFLNNFYMKKYLLVFLFVLFFSKSVFAQEVSTSGFLPGQIWYSSNELVEGKTVSIHTALWNGDVNALSVRVEFYDKNVILGSRDVVVLKDKLMDVSVPWKVTAGDHVISAKIISSTIVSGSNKEPVSLERNKTSEDKQFVSVNITTVDGVKTQAPELIKNQIEDVASAVEKTISPQISKPIISSISTVEDFRQETSDKVENEKKIAQKKIAQMSVDSVSNILSNKLKDPSSENFSIENASKELFSDDKPLQYVKLFFLSGISILLKNKLIFYPILVFVIFRLIVWIFSLFTRRD
jgi:hypothetical protein